MARKAKKEPTWNDCVFASLEAIRDCANGRFRYFVWPEEGEFTNAGSFRFNAEHQGEFEPLAIDKISADMMLALHSRLNPTRQAIFEEWIAKSRGHFAYMWEMTQEAVTITGFTSR